MHVDGQSADSNAIVVPGDAARYMDQRAALGELPNAPPVSQSGEKEDEVMREAEEIQQEQREEEEQDIEDDLFG